MTLAAHLPGAFRWQFGRRSSQTGEKQTTEEGGLQERYLFRFSRSRNKTATTTGPPLRRARARPAAPPPPPPTRPGVRHFPIGALLGVKPLRVKRERCKEERERRERGGLPPCRLPSLCGCGANVTKRLREKVCTIYKSGGGGAGRGRTDGRSGGRGGEEEGEGRSGAAVQPTAVQWRQRRKSGGGGRAGRGRRRRRRGRRKTRCSSFRRHLVEFVRWASEEREETDSHFVKDLINAGFMCALATPYSI